MGKTKADDMQFWFLKKFISYDDKPIYALASKMLFWTGMRCGELLALTWKDIEKYKNKLYSFNKTDRIFCFTRFFLSYEMKRICKKSEVKRIRIHDLRHSHASLLIEIGFTQLLILKRLGHENVKTTSDTYSHLYLDKGITISNKLDDIY